MGQAGSGRRAGRLLLTPSAGPTVLTPRPHRPYTGAGRRSRGRLPGNPPHAPHARLRRCAGAGAGNNAWAALSSRRRALLPLCGYLTDQTCPLNLSI